MDERIDILTKNGKPTGKTAMKSKAHRNGLFHETVHIWLYTDDGKILLQKRALNKKIHPALWDVSVAGHIGAGEDILESAVRETHEEIGLKTTKNQLQKIGVFKSIQKHSETLMDYEFHHTFIVKMEVPIDALTQQESEVADLKLCALHQFEKDINHPEKSKAIVPHTLAYYNTILETIKKSFS